MALSKFTTGREIFKNFYSLIAHNERAIFFNEDIDRSELIEILLIVGRR